MKARIFLNLFQPPSPIIALGNSVAFKLARRHVMSKNISVNASPPRVALMSRNVHLIMSSRTWKSGSACRFKLLELAYQSTWKFTRLKLYNTHQTTEWGTPEKRTTKQYSLYTYNIGNLGSLYNAFLTPNREGVEHHKQSGHAKSKYRCECNAVRQLWRGRIYPSSCI